MICRNCENQLPDNALFCNVCGETVMLYDPPEGFELDPESLRYRRTEIDGSGVEWVTFFDANTGEYEQVSYPVDYPSPPAPAYIQPEYQYVPQSEPVAPPHLVQETAHIKQTGGKKKGRGGIIAALAVVLLLGGAVGGHFLGFYTLPLLPERSDEGITSPPSPAETPDTTQPGTDETPDTAQPGTSGDTGTDPSLGFAYDEPDEHGFIEASFTYGLDGMTLSRIDNILLRFDPSREINLNIADISDLRLFKDGREIYVSISAIHHERWGRDDPYNIVLLALDPAPTEPGEYSATFTLFGKTYETIAGSGSAIGQSDFAGQDSHPPGEYTLRYVFQNISIYVDNNNPMRGKIDLRGFDLPDTVTLGLWDSEMQRGFTEAHFGVSFASNMDFVYEVMSGHWEGFGWLEGEVTLEQLIVSTMEYDINNGSGQGIGNSWLTRSESLSSNFTWEFVLPDDAEVDLNNLLYIGFDIRIYDEIRYERTYARPGGFWEHVSDTIVATYIRHYDYYN